MENCTKKLSRRAARACHVMYVGKLIHDLNAALWENVVMLNLARMDRFLPAIMSVIYAGISLAQARAAARRQARGELRCRRRPPTEAQDIVLRRFINN